MVRRDLRVGELKAGLSGRGKIGALSALACLRQLRPLGSHIHDEKPTFGE